MRRTFFAVLFALSVLPALLHAGNQPAPPKLKALLITGGGYHDWKAINPVLTTKISELAHVTIDVKSGLDTLKDPKFADGYDVVLYNFCFGKDNDKVLIENALKVTRDGKPTMMIHCAMHTFQASDEWTDCCGMRTRVHDPYRTFAVVKADKEHPVVKTLADNWQTPGDELYQTIKLGERSTALLRGQADKGKSDHIVCWVSTYGKGKVFATTLGHDLKTVNMPEYHRLLASGLLWACDKLGKDGKPLEGFAGPAPK
jgi:type 1 glutamine amidotransferase